MPALKARVARAVLVAVVAFWAWLLASRGTGVASGADSSGYYNLARLLARGRSTEQVRPIPGVAMGSYHPLVFTPLGFAPGERQGELRPVYPPGFPAHLALAARLVGWDRAGVLVNTIAGVAALLLVYLLARRFELPPGWALAAVVLFGSFPVTILYYTCMFSDGLATTWCAAAVACALGGRRSAAWAGLAGASLGVAVLVRPTNVLLLPVLLLALGPGRRRLLAFVVGGLPIAVALGAYNLATHGAVLTTGYAGVGALLSPAYFFPRLGHFAAWFARFWTPLALLLWLGIAVGALRGDPRHRLLAAWIVPFVVFYACYYHSIEAWWYLRFLLPVAPALVVGALLVARQAGEAAVTRWGTRPGVRRAVALLLIGAALWAAVGSRHWIRRLRVVDLGARAVEYQRGVEWMRSQVPADSVIASFETSGAVYSYSAFPVVRYDLLDTASASRLAAELRGLRRPFYALLLEFEVPGFRQRFGGAFVELGRSGRSSLFRLTE